MLTERMFQNGRKSGFLSYALLAIIVLAPIAVAIPYIVPTYDDYYYHFKTTEQGFWGVQAWWFLNASGRYLSNLLLSAGVFLVFQSFLYRLLLVVFFICLLICLHRLMNRLSRVPALASGFHPWMLTASTLCFFLQVTPGFSEFVFWYTGAGTYSIGITLTLLFISTLFFVKEGSRFYRLALMLLISLLACGTIEFAGLFVAAALVFYFYQSIRSEGWNFRKLLLSHESMVLLVVLCTLYFIVAGAPGNHIRFETEKLENTSAGDFGFAVTQGVLGTLKFLYYILWVRGGLLLFFAIFLSAAFSGTGKDVGDAPKGRRWSDWLVAQIILVGLTLLISVMYCFSTGVSTMIPRTLSVLAFYWSLDLIASAILLANLIPLPLRISVTRWVGVICLAPAAYLLLLVVFSPNSNIHRLYADHKAGRVSEYRDFQLKQADLFRHCDDAGLRRLEPPIKPMTYIWDISDGHMDTRYFRYYWEALCGQSMNNVVP